jgi:hypothetical protein
MQPGCSHLVEGTAVRAWHDNGRAVVKPDNVPGVVDRAISGATRGSEEKVPDLLQTEIPNVKSTQSLAFGQLARHRVYPPGARIGQSTGRAFRGIP